MPRKAVKVDRIPPGGRRPRLPIVFISKKGCGPTGAPQAAVQAQPEPVDWDEKISQPPTPRPAVREEYAGLRLYRCPVKWDESKPPSRTAYSDWCRESLPA